MTTLMVVGGDHSLRMDWASGDMGSYWLVGEGGVDAGCEATAREASRAGS